MTIVGFLLTKSFSSHVFREAQVAYLLQLRYIAWDFEATHAELTGSAAECHTGDLVSWRAHLFKKLSLERSGHRVRKVRSSWKSNGSIWLFQAKRFKKGTRESACIVGFVCENPKIRPSYSQISNICLPGLNMTLWLQYVLATLSPRNAMDLWVYCGLC